MDSSPDSSIYDRLRHYALTADGTIQAQTVHVPRPLHRLMHVTSVHLTRVVTFSAAHRYFRPGWSAEQNAAAFGACANEHGHGHTYECRITVSGTVNHDTSMIINLAELDRILKEEVTQRLDHRHINYDVPEFAFGKQIPTVEALAAFIWKQVSARLPDAVKLESVRVQEDPSLYAEYRGDR